MTPEDHPLGPHQQPHTIRITLAQFVAAAHFCDATNGHQQADPRAEQITKDE